MVGLLAQLPPGLSVVVQVEVCTQHEGPIDEDIQVMTENQIVCVSVRGWLLPPAFDLHVLSLSLFVAIPHHPTWVAGSIGLLQYPCD